MSDNWVTVLVGSFGPIIAIIGYYLTVKANKAQRINESITSQRTDWINKLRDEFVRFNELYEKNTFMHYLHDKHKEKNDNLYEDYFSLIGSINRIVLMINPKEIFASELIKEMKDGSVSVINAKFSRDICRKHAERILDFQQIIMKAEWRRIREETNNGKPITTEKMNCILKEEAQKLNEKLYTEVMEGLN